MMRRRNVSEERENQNMALKRSLLKTMGLNEEQIDEIIAAHTETVDALKEEMAGYKDDAKEYAKIKPAYEQMVQDNYKKKFEDLTAEYDDYKTKSEKREAAEKKTAAYRKLLKSAGVADKRIDTILKVTDIDGLELNGDGTLKDAEKLETAIKDEWADFVVSERTKGAGTETPPGGKGSPDGNTSRAASVAKSFYENMYGGTEE